jgi:hypothetical protein
MNIEALSPFTEDIRSKTVKVLTLRDILAQIDRTTLAGAAQLDETLSSPEEVLAYLLEVEEEYCPAVLFCRDIHRHENGSEYVSALRLKGRKEIVVEKYFLDDPMLPSFGLALKH